MKQVVFLAPALLLVLLTSALQTEAQSIESISLQTDSVWNVGPDQYWDNHVEYYMHTTIEVESGANMTIWTWYTKESDKDYFEAASGSVYIPISGPMTDTFLGREAVHESATLEAFATRVKVVEGELAGCNLSVISLVVSDSTTVADPESIHWWYDVDSQIETEEAYVTDCHEVIFINSLMYLDDTIRGWDNTYNYYDTAHVYAEYWNVDEPENIFTTQVHEPVPGQNYTNSGPLDLPPGTYQYRSRADVEMTWGWFGGGTVTDSIFGETLEVTIGEYNEEYDLEVQIDEVDTGPLLEEGGPVYLVSLISQDLDVGNIQAYLDYEDDLGNSETGINLGAATVVGPNQQFPFAYNFPFGREYQATLRVEQTIMDECLGEIFLEDETEVWFTTPEEPVFWQNTEIELDQASYTTADFSFDIQKNSVNSEARVRYFLEGEIFQEEVFNADSSEIEFSDDVEGLISNTFYAFEIVVDLYDPIYEEYVGEYMETISFTTQDDTPVAEISNVEWSIGNIGTTEAVFDLSYESNETDTGVQIRLLDSETNEVIYSEYNEPFDGYSLSETIENLVSFSEYSWKLELVVTDWYWDTEETLEFDPISFQTASVTPALTDTTLETIEVLENQATLLWSFGISEFDGESNGWIRVIDENEEIFFEEYFQSLDFENILEEELILEELSSNTEYSFQLCWEVYNNASDITFEGCGELVTFTTDFNDSLDEFENESLTLFPNPTTETLYVSGLQNPAQLQVFDSQGKVVLVQLVSENETISFAGLAKGLYLVNLLGESHKIELR